jgi:hypothetical protein
MIENCECKRQKRELKISYQEKTRNPNNARGGSVAADLLAKDIIIDQEKNLLQLTEIAGDQRETEVKRRRRYLALNTEEGIHPDLLPKRDLGKRGGDNRLIHPPLHLLRLIPRNHHRWDHLSQRSSRFDRIPLR